MKKVNVLFTIVALFLLYNCNEKKPIENANKETMARDVPSNSPWFSQKSFYCQQQGFSIKILRKNGYFDGQSPYKIEVDYSATISEHCGQARRDILASTHSGSSQFNSSRITYNARSEEYCSKNNTWIIGTVYQVSYPSPMQGIIYTTNEMHDSDIHNNSSKINDLVSAYNQIRGAHPSISVCNEAKCGKGSVKPPSGDPKPNPVIIGSRDRMKKIKKMMEDDIRYVDYGPKTPKDSTGGAGGTVKPILIGDKEFLARAKKLFKDDFRYVEY